MIRAREEVKGSVNVELFFAHFEDERPNGFDTFISTKLLNQSVLDQHSFEKPIKLPLIKDILDRLYAESKADYLIYTNVDIAVQPNFYSKIKEFIEKGHDAFMINRRRISGQYNSVEQLEEMYKEKGKKHPGFDCFVFHRSLYPNFGLGKICIGVPFFEITLSQNLFAWAKNPKVFMDEFLTFHIGMEIFKKRAPKEYFKYNQKEFWKVAEQLSPILSTRKWLYGEKPLLKRLFLWGLHPCFPIKLALTSEYQQFQKKLLE